MEFKVHAIRLTKTRHEIARNPNIVSSLLGTLAKNLELPLSLGNLRIDSLVVDARVQTQIEMLVDNFTSDVAYGVVPYAGVILSLRRRKSLFREAERAAILVKKILLLETRTSVSGSSMIVARELVGCGEPSGT